jgi:hypothetical protein
MNIAPVVAAWLVVCLVVALGLIIVVKAWRGDIDIAAALLTEPSETTGTGGETARRRVSASRLQLLIVTFVMLVSIGAVTIRDGALPSIPAPILGLLGISTGTYLIAEAMHRNVWVGETWDAAEPPLGWVARIVWLYSKSRLTLVAAVAGSVALFMIAVFTPPETNPFLNAVNGVLTMFSSAAHATQSPATTLSQPRNNREIYIGMMFGILFLAFIWCLAVITLSSKKHAISFAKKLCETLGTFFVGAVTGYLG